jgi:uncharacterized membrane protein YbhN (UPF0104 family)
VVEQVLLVLALLALVGAVVVAFVPVSNPGVQSCGSPVLFSWRITNDVVLPAPGTPGAPSNLSQLEAQAPCHERVDQRLVIAGLLVALVVGAGLAGAFLGLIDDRSRYRASPRFEHYLRERPDAAPSDPWDRPIVPESDLGRRLPDLEWREIRVILWVTLGAAALLLWLGPWAEVRDALGHLRIGWIVVALLLTAVTYPIASAGVLAATEPGAPGADRTYQRVLATAVAASFIGHLLPEYGARGLADHQLVRAGDERDRVTPRLSSAAWIAVGVHAALLVLIGFVAVATGTSTGSTIDWQWAVGLASLVLVLVGLFSAPRRYANLVVRPDGRGWRELSPLLRDPVRAAGVVASAVAIALLDALVLLAATRVVGSGAPAAAVLAVGLLLAVIAVVSPTPAGAGLVEAVAVLGLVWAGVPGGPAVVAALLARLVSFWLPMLPGWIVSRQLVRRGIL